jgi:hypothetical protein
MRKTNGKLKWDRPNKKHDEQKFGDHLCHFAKLDGTGTRTRDPTSKVDL